MRNLQTVLKASGSDTQPKHKNRTYPILQTSQQGKKKINAIADNAASRQKQDLSTKSHQNVCKQGHKRTPPTHVLSALRNIALKWCTSSSRSRVNTWPDRPARAVRPALRTHHAIYAIMRPPLQQRDHSTLHSICSHTQPKSLPSTSAQPRPAGHSMTFVHITACSCCSSFMFDTARHCISMSTGSSSHPAA